MGKMMYGLILMFGIQLALVLFAGAAWPGSALYTLLIDPTQWDSAVLLDQLIRDGLLVAGAGVIAVGSLIYRNEFLIFAGLSAIFISFGSAIYEYWQFLAADQVFGDAGQIIGTILMSGLIIMWIIIALDYARGRD